MAELVTDCPRCGSAKTTFDVLEATVIRHEYGWQNWREAFCVCRHCGRSTVFVVADEGTREAEYISQKGLSNLPGSINKIVRIQGYVTAKDRDATPPPEHLPPDIHAAFVEGATCLAVNCYNAAGTMFRLCVDKATRALLPPEDAGGLNAKIRRNLGLRLPWLIDAGLLPGALRELSSCIKDDGNDGAHDGSLAKQDAEDLLDFTFVLLERLFTEPARLRIANERRLARREKGPN